MCNLCDELATAPSDQIIDCDVFIAGSGPIGATFAREVLKNNNTAKVYMAEIGSQDNPVIGAHHKNSIKYQKDIDSFVHVIQGALQPISLPPPSSFLFAQGGSGWRPQANSTGSVHSHFNPDQKPDTNLHSYVTRTVGGMATHWTCACPKPHAEESTEITKLIPEIGSLLDEAKGLLNVNLNEFDISIRHRLVKKALDVEPYKNRVANLPLAVERNKAPNDTDYVTWSGVDTVFGEYHKTHRFTLGTEMGVIKLCSSKDDPKKIVGAAVRNLRTHKIHLVRAKKYVIACGAIGTPQVLFNSGITEQVLPALGHYLTEQSLTFCQIILKKDLIDSIPVTYAKDPKFIHHNAKYPNDLPIPFTDPEPQVTLPYAPSTPWHVQIHRDAFAYGGVGPKADPRVVVDLRFFGKQDVDYKNCVTFSETVTDLYGMPQATFNVSRNKDDHDRDQRMMQDMCTAANLLGSYLPGSEPTFMEPGLVLHVTGTTRLGTNEGAEKDKSVADANSKVHGFEDLYVGGNGCIPDSTACNPTLTSVAYAIKSARHIASTLPGSEPKY